MTVIKSIADFVGRWFALLVLAGGVVGLLAPAQTAAVAPHIPLLLGVIMFGMMWAMGCFPSSRGVIGPNYTPAGATLGQF
jgi:predicted Na+-dependent transporter